MTGLEYIQGIGGCNPSFACPITGAKVISMNCGIKAGGLHLNATHSDMIDAKSVLMQF
jgi:hypothetical protein